MSLFLSHVGEEIWVTFCFQLDIIVFSIKIGD